MRKTFTMVLLGLACVGNAWAQDTEDAPDAPSVHVGSRVRLRAGKRSFVGKVKKIERGTLTLLDDTRLDPVEVPTASITKVQLSINHRRHGAKGALIGAGAGALVGALAMTGATDCGLVFYESCTADRVARNIAGLAAGGALWGTLIGALVVTEKWRDASVEDIRGAGQIRVSIAPVRRGAGLAVSVAF